MPLHFTTAEDASSDQGVKILVYAGAGMGKTVLAATLPNPILISAEAGTLSLRKKNLERLFGVEAQGICYNVPTIVISTLDDLTDAFNWCQSSREAKQFQSLALDSISEIGEKVLNNAKRQVKDVRQAYGELIEKMGSTIRLFRDIPQFNVYMSSKMEPSTDQLTGIIKYGPSMPGSKLGPSLPYFFDEVFRLGVNSTPQGENYRFFQTQPDLQYEAKDRSGALAPIEMPHLGYVINKILGD